MALVSNGTYLVYDVANNQMTGSAALGQVGPNWQFGGFAAASPTGSAALVQAMASFAAPDTIDASSTAAFGVDMSQQLNLLSPGHA
jgi:hypothetical protein